MLVDLARLPRFLQWRASVGQRPLQGHPILTVSGEALDSHQLPVYLALSKHHQTVSLLKTLSVYTQAGVS